MRREGHDSSRASCFQLISRPRPELPSRSSTSVFACRGSPTTSSLQSKPHAAQAATRAPLSLHTWNRAGNSTQQLLWPPKIFDRFFLLRTLDKAKNLPGTRTCAHCWLRLMAATSSDRKSFYKFLYIIVLYISFYEFFKKIKFRSKFKGVSLRYYQKTLICDKN
jgi:hypothetical protein